MLAHPAGAGDGVTTSITLSRFSVSHVYLSIARQFLVFCSATPENSKEDKNRDIKRKESMDLCYSKNHVWGNHFEKSFGKIADKIQTST